MRVPKSQGCMLCVSRWLGNFVMSSREVARAVDVSFCLKENPRP